MDMSYIRNMQQSLLSERGSAQVIVLILAIIVVGAAVFYVIAKQPSGDSTSTGSQTADTMMDTSDQTMTAQTGNEDEEQQSDNIRDMMKPSDPSDLLAVDASATAEVMATDAEGQPVHVFNITGWKFAFSRDEMKVKRGERVRVNFISVDGYHDWVVDEFSAETEKVETGGTTSVEFVADQAGSFEYYCSVGEHRALGMKGTLIVEE